MKKKYLDIPKGEAVVIVFPVLMARLFGITAVEQTRNGHITVADISNRLYSLGLVKQKERGTIDIQHEKEKGTLNEVVSSILLPLCTSHNHTGSWH